MKFRLTLLIATLLLVLAAIGSATVGVIRIPLDTVFPIFKAQICQQAMPPEWQLYALTLRNLRIPRILLSMLAGAALALCGAAFQSIFRNPICDPYILGISSGASLGAAIAIILGLDIYIFGLTLSALVTALITLGMVLAIAATGNRKSVETILLAGIALNFLVSAIVTLLMVLHQESLEEILFWTMGSFANASWSEAALLGGAFCLIAFILFFYSNKLNVMQLGNDIAQTSGIRTQHTTWMVLIWSSVLIAATVAFCGVIGFVGLIIPHIVRLLIGNNVRQVFALSIVLGAFFCLLADGIARLVAAPAELPVGSVTALAGAPYFLTLLIVKRCKSII